MLHNEYLHWNRPKITKKTIFFTLFSSNVYSSCLIVFRQSKLQKPSEFDENEKNFVRFSSGFGWLFETFRFRFDDGNFSWFVSFLICRKHFSPMDPIESQFPNSVSNFDAPNPTSLPSPPGRRTRCATGFPFLLTIYGIFSLFIVVKIFVFLFLTKNFGKKHFSRSEAWLFVRLNQCRTRRWRLL